MRIFVRKKLWGLDKSVPAEVWEGPGNNSVIHILIHVE